MRPLFEVPDHPGGIYDRLRTYLCHITSGEARPGVEPEVDTPEHTTIREVGWFDLRAPTTWNALVRGDPITMPLLRQLRAAGSEAAGGNAASAAASRDRAQAAPEALADAVAGRIAAAVESKAENKTEKS